MIKRTITYTDFNDVQHTEDFYFNLSSTEIVDLQFGTEGGLSELMQKIVKEEDAHRIIEMFKMIITASIGVKSEDGKRFIKNDDIRDSFMQSEAYSELFMELAGDAAAAAAFIRGIVPKNLAEKAAALPATPDGTPKTKTFDDYTQEELLAMEESQFKALLPKDPGQMTQPQLIIAMRRTNKNGA